MPRCRRALLREASDDPRSSCDEFPGFRSGGGSWPAASQETTGELEGWHQLRCHESAMGPLPRTWWVALAPVLQPAAIATRDSAVWPGIGSVDLPLAALSAGAAGTPVSVSLVVALTRSQGQAMSAA
mmetsp:Transcript_98637/g.263758  ORF Transcript_98637/g.263758 Transcript_98637/m.263758 type:complete len:127 (+) Transcript_98637:357-737(+)